jgi:carboxypeptidase Taq
MNAELKALDERLRKFWSLDKTSSLLEWDQQVNMPHGGARARGEQVSAVLRLAHETLTDPETGRLLAKLTAGACADEPLVRWAAREYERRRKLPAVLVEELAAHSSLAHGVWVEARTKSDFALFRPALEKMVDLKRRQADALGAYADPYDAWLEEFEPGLPTAEVDRLFADLKAGLVPLVKAVAAKAGAVDDAPLRGRFPVPAQRDFATTVAKAMGFDFTRGRQDLASHPFCMSLAPGDVRITSRFSENLGVSGLFGVMHEAGHGLYEQGVDEALAGTPLCGGATMAVHESQSRLWENIVGRSRGFWRHFYPRFQEAFPALNGVPLEDFYRAVNKASASFIRVEADELTYGLHILLRFELERELLSGKLKPRDLPAAWNEKTRSYLGLAVPDDRAGVLQDVHWAEGLFGYFPTYAVGNMISVQLYEAAVAAAPGLPAGVEKGEMAPLLGWLREHVHRHGRTMFAPELVRRATGKPIAAAPYLAYLGKKYGEIYGL